MSSRRAPILKNGLASRDVCLDFTAIDLMSVYDYCNSVAFFKVYLDESGTQADPPVTCVAGVMARKSSWISLSAAWERVLKKYRVSAFHATDLYNFKKEFKDWTVEKRDAFVNSLFKVIRGEKALRSIGVVVRPEKFRSVAPEYRDVDLAPYDLCAIHCIVIASDIAMSKKDIQPVAIVFEATPDIRWKIYEHGMKWLSDPAFVKRFKIKQIATIDKMGVRPLEVADFWSHSLYRFHRDQIEGKPIGYPFLKFQEYTTSYGKFLSEEDLREAFEVYRQIGSS